MERREYRVELIHDSPTFCRLLVTDRGNQVLVDLAIDSPPLDPPTLTGIDADDPEGYFNLRQRFAMIWRYDERGRMIGEHIYEAKAFFEVLTLEADEYVTVEDARASLLPMLRPLPKFDPSGSNLRR